MKVNCHVYAAAIFTGFIIFENLHCSIYLVLLGTNLLTSDMNRFQYTTSFRADTHHIRVFRILSPSVPCISHYVNPRVDIIE